MYTRKSEYIVTSILVNGFYFLRKLTALQPSVTKFLKSTQVLDKPSKKALLIVGYEGHYLQFYVAPTLC